MAAALSMEQGGSYYHYQLRDMIQVVETWARDEERDGMPLLEHPSTLARLARVYTHACISEALTGRALWTRLAGQPDMAYGPASKIFSTQSFIDDSADLIDLAAPTSLLRGKAGLGVVEIGYRHSTATSIYGGTSEVLRSMVAEKRLGLPRSRA
jgi:alkylation response protein AidB-like acyl-CoA dehydrogenase